ncbi:hypothetical protein P4O66_007575, partial [Electrophorus voltai]
TGAPQGCVLSPLLYSLYTYDCVATSSSTIIVKFADDTAVMGLISDNDERAYLEEIKHLENWCQGNNLLLNVSKTKELIVDCSEKQEWHYQPDLSWSRHTNSLKRRLVSVFATRWLRDFRLPFKVLQNFYTCTIESILTGNITVWFGNSTKQDRHALQRVVRSTERITHTELPDLQTIYYKRMNSPTRTQRESETLGGGFAGTKLRLFLHSLSLSQHHQSRDSKSSGNAGTRASCRSQKKQDPVYFDDDKIPGKHQESTRLDQRSRGERPAAQDVHPTIGDAASSVPVPGIVDAASSVPVPGIVDSTSSVPVLGIVDAARPVTRSVPVAAPPDLLPPLMATAQLCARPCVHSGACVPGLVCFAYL